MTPPPVDRESPAPAQSPPPVHRTPESTAEWVSFSLALLILIGVIVLVSYLWASDRQQQPPLLQVTTQETRLASGQYYVPFVVTNQGGETAAAVQVVAELRVNGEVFEAGEQILNFLSSREQAEGAFVFSRNPQQGELIVRVASYKKP